MSLLLTGGAAPTAATAGAAVAGEDRADRASQRGQRGREGLAFCRISGIPNFRNLKILNRISESATAAAYFEAPAKIYKMHIRTSLAPEDLRPELAMLCEEKSEVAIVEAQMRTIVRPGGSCAGVPLRGHLPGVFGY